MNEKTENLLCRFAHFIEMEANAKTQKILNDCISEIWSRERNKAKSNGKRLSKCELKALNVAKGYLTSQIQKLKEK